MVEASDDRTELVERIIRDESKIRLLERALREMGEHYDLDRADVSYVIAQQARIEGLERNVAILSRRPHEIEAAA